MILHIVSLFDMMVVYVWNLRMTKIAFSPFFSQQCNLTQQHLLLLFISVLEAIVSNPHDFHSSSNVFEHGAVATTSNIHTECDGCCTCESSSKLLTPTIICSCLVYSNGCHAFMREKPLPLFIVSRVLFQFPT